MTRQSAPRPSSGLPRRPDVSGRGGPTPIPALTVLETGDVSLAIRSKRKGGRRPMARMRYRMGLDARRSSRPVGRAARAWLRFAGGAESRAASKPAFAGSGRGLVACLEPGRLVFVRLFEAIGSTLGCSRPRTLFATGPKRAMALPDRGDRLRAADRSQGGRPRFSLEIGDGSPERRRLESIAAAVIPASAWPR